jgi:hypothetical protein
MTLKTASCTALALLSLVFLSLAGCVLDQSKKSGADGGDTADAAVSPERACLVFAEYLATAGQRCGQDYQVVYDDFLRTAVGGDCSRVTSIRDFDGLWDKCLVLLQNESCADVNAGFLDKTCSNQLIVK